MPRGFANAKQQRDAGSSDQILGDDVATHARKKMKNMFAKGVGEVMDLVPSSPENCEASQRSLASVSTAPPSWGIRSCDFSETGSDAGSVAAVTPGAADVDGSALECSEGSGTMRQPSPDDIPAGQGEPPAHHGSSCGPHVSGNLENFFAELEAIQVTENGLSVMEEFIQNTRRRASPAEVRVPTKLEAVAITGQFDVRDSVGQHFSRSHGKGTDMHLKYHAINGRENKRVYREAWAKKEYANYTEAKEHLKSYESVDTDLGEMLTFGAMVLLYGGWSWKPAVTGAKRTLGKCSQLGGKWLDKDPFSELARCFILRKQHAGIFAEKWAEYEKEVSDITNKGICGPATSTSALTAGTAKVARLEPCTTPAKRHPEKAKLAGKVKAEPVSESKAVATKLLKQAVQVKAQIGKHRSAAENLVRIIKSEPSYAWADSGASRGALELCLAELESCICTFAKDFMVLPLKVVEEKYGTKWLAELETFCSIQLVVGKMQKLTDKIISMHSKSV